MPPLCAMRSNIGSTRTLAAVDDRAETVGNAARDVLVKAAARYVRDTALTLTFLKKRKHWL